LTFVRQHWPDIRYLALIFALAFVVRLAFVLWVDPDPRLAKNDSWFYFHSAEVGGWERIRLPFHGNQFASPDCGSPAGDSAAGRRVPPTWTGPSYKLVNIFIGVPAAACSISSVGWRPGRVGIAAGLLLTFFPAVFYSALPITEVTYPLC
jgi:hypothetical protein